MLRIHVFAAAAALCLLSPSAAAAETLVPQGPGTVFPSLTAAAVDALHFVEQQGPSTRAQGGTIVRTAGGYTYQEPKVGRHDEINVTLTSDTVAWFFARRYVRPSDRTRRDERLSLEARWMVDRVDPQKRPVFLLTPGRKILTYNDARVAVVEAPSAPVASQDDR